MTRILSSRVRLGIALVVVSSFFVSCSTQANSRYFGKNIVPENNVLRYISGSEPESLDPHVGTGQPEARIYIALYDGLVEFHPKTMEPIPSIATSWKVSPDATEYIFKLRKDARFSNGEPITANDFVYSYRRALEPAFAAKNGYLSYPIKYAEAYNTGLSFVKMPDGDFLRKKDFAEKSSSSEADDPAPKEGEEFSSDSDHHKMLDEPERLAIPSDEEGQKALFEKTPGLKEKVEAGELVPAKAEDIGVEAIDDYTLRIKLKQPAPYFIGLLTHQFFRVINKGAVEKHGKDWVKPGNIVTSGSFKLVDHKPYDEVIVEKDPMNWDAKNVKLDGIEFYPMDEATSMMNIYKYGGVEAVYNHVPPAAWNDQMRVYKDEYLDFPEVAVGYYTFNVTKPPMDNLDVRKAFALAIDRKALATFRRTVQPLVDFTPEGIFPKYEEARKKVYSELLAKEGSSLEEWKKREFDPEKARELLAKAGYPVEGSEGNYSSPKFPIEKVGLLYNTSESNKDVAEFVQAQWKQNLGITVPLRNMEWKTFLNVRKELDYDGIGRAGWVGDYMDPYTFLGLFYT
ncbi:MAG: peptide ABC transporter substrate-binding protein, partial [Pyrinomonadaceae bacterium]|nr:peptide ABC transporter substrate-binding protein [Pyrinomonadaceae bacterium]